MDIEHFNDCAERRNLPWNKGKLTGAKPPLRPKHVWANRTAIWYIAMPVEEPSTASQAVVATSADHVSICANGII